MLIRYKNMEIRNAEAEDGELLASWWNDGKVMAHAGFPHGVGETPQEIAEDILSDEDSVKRRLIIELDGIPIGEMNYRSVEKGIAEIGIKICDFSKQEQGYGRIALSMLISRLFHTLKYQKIILDTNLDNKRAQHVYETLGFNKTGVRMNSWKNQVGELQSSVDYELTENQFIDFTKRQEETHKI